MESEILDPNDDLYILGDLRTNKDKCLFKNTNKTRKLKIKK